jgi:YHS domain-containing protein
MRLLKHGITVIALVFGLVVSVQAGDADKQPVSDSPKELKNQTNCPVMGGKIDSTVYTDIQGQRVYHCCPMCSAKLKADPDTYFEKAAAEGVLFENIQTTCPVSGEKLEDKSVFTDYEGRRVVFCCKKCRGTFAEAPDKYLNKLDEGADTDTENKMEMDHSDHSGHDH